MKQTSGNKNRQGLEEFTTLPLLDDECTLAALLFIVTTSLSYKCVEKRDIPTRLLYDAWPNAPAYW